MKENQSESAINIFKLKKEIEDKLPEEDRGKVEDFMVYTIICFNTNGRRELFEENARAQHWS